LKVNLFNLSQEGSVLFLNISTLYTWRSVLDSMHETECFSYMSNNLKIRNREGCYPSTWTRFNKVLAPASRISVYVPS